MLVLTRKLNEQIIIGKNGEIILQVVEIVGNKVRLGIVAPEDVPVMRLELLEQLKEQSNS